MNQHVPYVPSTPGPKLSREELDEQIDALAASMPTLIAEVREECQMEVFAGIADGIRESASEEDARHVWARLQCVLRDNGLIPGDDEPCDPGAEHDTPDDDAVSQ